MPPPKRAAVGLGIYAGSMIQTAESNGIMKKSILIMLHSNISNKEQIKTLR